MIHSISERTNRLKRLDNELTHQVKKWRYYPVVKAIQAMRSRFLIQKKGKLVKKEKSSGRAIGRNLCGSLDVGSHTNALHNGVVMLATFVRIFAQKVTRLRSPI